MNLYVKSISKSIKGEKVLDDISYTFESGKIYGIYGKNGSGVPNPQRATVEVELPDDLTTES